MNFSINLFWKADQFNEFLLRKVPKRLLLLMEYELQQESGSWKGEPCQSNCNFYRSPFPSPDDPTQTLAEILKDRRLTS